MTTAYLLQNQDNLFLDKSGEWVEGDKSQSLYRTPHKDEAINKKVEFSVKNADLRLKIAEAKILDKGALELIDKIAPKNQKDINDSLDESSLFSVLNESSSVKVEVDKETDTEMIADDFEIDQSATPSRLNNIYTAIDESTENQAQGIDEESEIASPIRNQPDIIANETLDQNSSGLENDEILNTETKIASLDETSVSPSMNDTPIEDAVNDESKKSNETTKISSLY